MKDAKKVNGHPALTFPYPSSLNEDAVQVGAGQLVSHLSSQVHLTHQCLRPKHEQEAQPLNSNEQSKATLSLSFIKITLVYLGGHYKKSRK